MTRIGFVFALAVAICPVMRAGTIVTTSLSLTSLTITPNLGGDSGLVQIQPGVYGPVFVGVFVSLGDLGRVPSRRRPALPLLFLRRLHADRVRGGVNEPPRREDAEGRLAPLRPI